jgi:hypothetical protein
MEAVKEPNLQDQITTHQIGLGLRKEIELLYLIRRRDQPLSLEIALTLQALVHT